jgi:sulfite reductase alpha subunit-like flavoprotein
MTGVLPNHIKAPCSAKEAFLHYCDIQALPSKRFLRMMADYCTSTHDKDKLIHLCSTKGAPWSSDIADTNDH